ncbi:hypothetical protein ACFX15_040287 [Malus domestica]
MNLSCIYTYDTSLHDHPNFNFHDDSSFQLLDRLHWSELATDEFPPVPHLATVLTLSIKASVRASCDKMSESCSGLITSFTFQTPLLLYLGKTSGSDGLLP